ncbi:helix-turn-helix domain-containing protein [Ferrimonas aestuarii]|uniref:Helix-turn-helix domain-containing protein n=1 Tax=Ferrimonas aestuarii TaxID=2569539 RepID=A0A4V5NXV9_9GAMM|nr:AraC family transcriptional regulator [Ferrimonas aestuarii]TKB50098.1 helix-turn-helix domain-containing protein [Ferrimonas aestuarii]
MRSKLQFIHYDNHSPSDCGEVLEIEFSSHKLDWQGVILEKGRSPHFYPTNVYTPYFYFAVALDKELNWNVGTGDDAEAIKAVTDDIWINPPTTPFTHEISEPCHFIILAIEEKLFLDNCPLPIGNLPLQFLNNYNVSDPSIRGIIELFVLEIIAKGRNGNTYLSGLVSLLSGHYIQNYSNFIDLQQAKQSASKFDQTQVDKVDAFIMENIGKPISVDDFAELLRCSKFYFLREFKKCVGVTPYQYLLSKRMELAMQKLSLDSPNIAAISHELGFNDQSHFTRAFKDHTGMTPGQYIKAKHSQS